MPEFPEILNRSQEMNTALSGKRFTGFDILQPKALNIPEDNFCAALLGARILNVHARGKWIFTETDQGWLLINLGMGGEILLVTRETLPDKVQLIFDFDDQTCLAIHFWWFGHVHYVPIDALDTHPQTSKLGPNILDIPQTDFSQALQGHRGGIKSFLLNQKRVAGIGNAYIHDILYLAGIHPLRPINSLTPAEIDQLYQAIQRGLQPSVDKGGAFYELNLFGEKGGFRHEDIIIGYREGDPCPRCSTTIEKIKTGSTSSYICPQCQPLQPTGN